METKEYTFINKSEWPSGQWQNEPDKVQWPDAETQMPCLAVRHPSSGHWCGYVGVTESHPTFQKDYDGIEVEVHGGLTFASKCQPGKEETGVCHIPGKDESDNVWWFGFDCAHCDDLSPAHQWHVSGSGRDETYRTLRYVQDECASLARQLKAMQ